MPVIIKITFSLILSTLFCVINLFQEDQTQSNKSAHIIQSLEQMRSIGLSKSKNSTEYSGKCGLQLSFDVIEHWKEFSELQKQHLMILLAPPSRQKSRVIGHFKIFYDTTGFEAPALVSTTLGCQRLPNTVEQYIDSVGKYFNEVWDLEINSLGYAQPPLQNDNTYWIDVHELGFGLYGRTFPDPNPLNSGNPSRYKTYIEIDNDFCDVYPSSRGIPGLKVTAAHEFHHAIQLGAYGTWGLVDYYFNEITSTWMEDVAYNDVDDYYQYLTNSLSQQSQFSYPSKRFTEYNGSIEYSRAIWGKFIEKRYSPNIMLRSWENMRMNTSIQAIDQALTEAGGSFRQAFLEWSLWNNNTGPNCDTVKYYSEGINYPPMRVRNVAQYTPPQRIILDSIQVLSSVYHPVIIDNAQMMVIISNVNTATITSALQGLSYTIAESGDETFKHLSNGVHVKLNVSDPQRWSTQESVPSVVNDVLVYPNPYLSNGTNVVHFRLPPVVDTYASLSVFSGALERLISKELPIREIQPSEPYITWDGKGERHEQANSGIYFYVITVDNKQYTGKFALIRK